MNSLGLTIEAASDAIRQIERGLPFSALERLAASLALEPPRIAQAIAIPERTLARRKSAGRLSPEESERLLRVSALFDRTLELFESDREAAVRWFLTPRKAFGDQAPLDHARWEPGAREIESTLARVEHGVF